MKTFKLAIIIFICIAITFCTLINQTPIVVKAHEEYRESEIIDYVENDKESVLVNSNNSTDREDASIISEEDDLLHNWETEEKDWSDQVFTESDEIVEVPESNNIEKPKNDFQQIVSQKVNPYDYTELITHANFSDVEIRLINDILKTYSAHKDDGIEYYEEELDYLPSFQNYQKVMSFFHLYYGMFEDIYDVVFDLKIHGNQYASIKLYMNNMRKFEAERDKNTIRIRDAISTFNKGTEKELVSQAAKYIADHTTYTKNYYDIDDILSSGRGVCNAYALTLMRFCQLLGIQNDLCLGYALGEFHAWNKVTYSDGTVEYFDITFFDSGNQNKYKYFNMSSSPHKIDSINDYYYQ